MRWYGIDDLSAEDTARLAQALKDMELSSGMDGLYWLPLELLVRARGRLRCDCVHYAGPELRAHMIAYLEQLLVDLGITG